MRTITSISDKCHNKLMIYHTAGKTRNFSVLFLATNRDWMIQGYLRRITFFAVKDTMF